LQVRRRRSTVTHLSPVGHEPLHALPRKLQGLAVEVVVLVVATVDELLLVELLVELVGGGSDVDVVAGSASDVVVGPCGGCVVDELVDVDVVGGGALLLVVVGGRVLLVVVGMVGAFVVEVLGRVPEVVVVVLVPTTIAGHALGAGAFRATKRPGLSLPIVPPKSRQ
jgi:hypothetical protein